MQLDKLELDLRPRPNAQALDLGFSLLRAHAANAYLAWLALWLPLVALCAALACFFPPYAGALLIAAWWLRPMLERAPLYVLSRQVFGEDAGWREALRAWPRQFGGGWFFLLTWGRLFAAGRGLYQPIWQLEGARGKVASERRSIIGKNGTARAAFWFGIACAHFEAILQIGLLAFIGIFVSDERTINPFALMVQIADAPNGARAILLSFAAFAFAGAIIGPVFVACGFTLYLNRRATLEAWDLEIALRQIKPPLRKGVGAQVAATLGVLLCAGSLAAMLVTSKPALAADAPAKCEAPKFIRERSATREADQSPAQTQIRRELAEVFDNDDLRGYVCKEIWKYKNETDKPKPERFPRDLPNLGWLADIIKIMLIAGAILLIGWFLYRYRDKFAGLLPARTKAPATEVAGMDIRPESLPQDVPARVAELWTQGQRRAALALLYRATISRLVNDDSLPLDQGATEGDCLRTALQAYRRQQLAKGRLQTTHSVTDLWLLAAYGDRWPDDDAVAAGCAQWRLEFGGAPA
jgi:hypothetical protein